MISHPPNGSKEYPSGNDFAVGLCFQSGNEDFSLHPSGAQSPPAGRVPVSSRPSGAQSHRFAAGPGLAHTKEIKRLRRGDLVLAAQANVQIDAEIGQKDHFRINLKTFSVRSTGPCATVRQGRTSSPAGL